MHATHACIKKKNYAHLRHLNVHSNIFIRVIQINVEVVLKHIIFTPFAVSRAIQKIKSSGSAGPDGLPTLFWKKAGAGVAFPLSIIFNNSFMSSSVPDEWRLATVIHIFKKGCPSSPNNYRPISLTCIPCKIMESIIKDHSHADLSKC